MRIAFATGAKQHIYIYIIRFSKLINVRLFLFLVRAIILVFVFNYYPAYVGCGECRHVVVFNFHRSPYVRALGYEFTFTSSVSTKKTTLPFSVFGNVSPPRLSPSDCRDSFPHFGGSLYKTSGNIIDSFVITRKRRAH